MFEPIGKAAERVTDSVTRDQVKRKWCVVPRPFDWANTSYVVCDHNHRVIAHVERREDADFFAAAPDLLSALEGMFQFFGSTKRDEWLNDTGFQEAVEVIKRARAAILKSRSAS